MSLETERLHYLTDLGLEVGYSSGSGAEVLGRIYDARPDSVIVGQTDSEVGVLWTDVLIPLVWAGAAFGGVPFDVESVAVIEFFSGSGTAGTKIFQATITLTMTVNAVSGMPQSPTDYDLSAVVIYNEIGGTTVVANGIDDFRKSVTGATDAHYFQIDEVGTVFDRGGLVFRVVLLPVILDALGGDIGNPARLDGDAFTLRVTRTPVAPAQLTNAYELEGAYWQPPTPPPTGGFDFSGALHYMAPSVGYNGSFVKLSVAWMRSTSGTPETRLAVMPFNVSGAGFNKAGEIFAYSDSSGFVQRSRDQGLSFSVISGSAMWDNNDFGKIRAFYDESTNITFTSAIAVGTRDVYSKRVVDVADPPADGAKVSVGSIASGGPYDLFITKQRDTGFLLIHNGASFKKKSEDGGLTWSDWV